MSKRIFLGITILVILALPAGCTTAGEPAPTPEAPAAPAVPTQPAATPTPTTPAADIPGQTEAEVCAAVWSELASLLPAGYEIGQLAQDTCRASYEEDEKWVFSVSGSGESFDYSPEELVEKSPDCWVYQKARYYTSYDLTVKAVYYTKPEQVEIVSAERSDENTRTEMDETPVDQKLQVKYLLCYFGSTKISFEGQIENTGPVPLENLKAEFHILDKDGKLLHIEDANAPATVHPYFPARIHAEIVMENVSEDWKHEVVFLTSHGNKFLLDETSPEDTPRFYYPSDIPD